MTVGEPVAGLRPPVPLRRVARVELGELVAAEGSDGTIPAFGANGIVGLTERSNVDEPSVVIGQRGSIGHPIIVRPPAWVTNNAIRLVPMTGCDVRFLKYALTIVDFAELSVSTAVPMITQGMVRALAIPSAPKDEQRRIADFLDRETARIDALIAKKRQLGELLRLRVRQETLLAMDAAARSFGTIPLRRVVRCLDGRRVPLNSEERAGRQGPYPYFGASGVVDHLDGYLFDEVIVLLGEDGAQLGDPHYPISRVVHEACWVNNHAHVLRPLGFNPDLLAAHLNTFDRVPFISGGTREKITQEDMGRIPVPAIPLDHQEGIWEQLRREANRVDALRGRLERQIDLLRERRQALITHAVTGRLPIPA